ncbi:mesenchyme-specific cell surface glycoprotein-like [Haliotis rufescens]|uniref:mesenchyme-specific cell surface glycoprotein-like n=1 Tax=Haliotis rufescens TaxID=6454 RepID=UPI00201FAFE5|nr:mesenchyme-specific cell surface glycoprotein-like [Haliotis rufescens]
MLPRLSVVVALVIFIGGCCGRYVIRPLGYLKLPNSVTPTDTYKILSGSAEEAAYDPDDQLIYVVGEGSRLLHVVDVTNPMMPKRLFTHEFSSADGVPRDVEVCNGEVVVAMSSDVPVFPGHVFFFRTYKRGSDKMDFDGKVTVGEFPDVLKFAPDCKTLVVGNEGRSGVDYAGRYLDPEGTLTIISKSTTGNPSERFVDFNKFNSRHEIRSVAKSIPSNLLSARSTIAQELEPEYVTVPSTTTAYVTFQENNLIAQINLKDATVPVLFTMPHKDFSDVAMDASDRDGGIHMQKFPLRGLRQPDVIKSLVYNRRTYLFVVDEGAMSSFTTASHSIQWDEGERAKVVSYQKGYDTSAITNASFLADLNDDSKLGRLYVSRIDGLNPFTSKIEDVYTYGGRGFSIWDGSSMAMLYDSGDELERRARDSYYNVFNSEGVEPTVYSPETLKDSVSDDMGPKPNAMDVIRDNNENFILVGSETTGIIYLYNVTLGTKVNVDFQDVYRRGKTDSLWSQLYDDDAAGDMSISDIGFISASQSPTNRTMFYVLGAGSGSVSLYEVEDLGPDLPSFP